MNQRTSPIAVRIDLELVRGEQAELERWIREWSQKLLAKSIVALYGEVGVGKTHFVSVLARTLGSQEVSQSPSFAIHHAYPGGRLTLDHVDLYRVENMDDLESTGFWDLFKQTDHVIVIEWAERIPTKYFPHDWKLWEIHLIRA